MPRRPRARASAPATSQAADDSIPKIMLPDLASAEFAHLDSSRVSYLNAASRTPLPARTLREGVAAMRKKAATPWDIGDTEAAKDTVRGLFASMLGPSATADDVCVVPSCSYAMSLAAHNCRARLRARPPGRRGVLVLQDQNPSNVMQWQQLCEEESGELCVVPPPAADGDWARSIVPRLSEGTIAVAALPPCHWCDGALVDLDAVGAACQAHGTLLVVDATQWLGAGPPIDVVRLGVAFLACSIHKWLLGPYGACVCYAAPSFWRSATPIEQHDRNREGAQHVECLPMDPREGYPAAFQHGCRRLDSGGRPSYIVMPMLRTSMRYLVEELRVDRVSEWLSAYTAEIARRASGLGFSAPRRHAPGIVGLRPDPQTMPDAATIVRRLKVGGAARRPVLVSERLGAIRISPHVYNTREDLERLISALQEAVQGQPTSKL